MLLNQAKKKNLDAVFWRFFFLFFFFFCGACLHGMSLALEGTVTVSFESESLLWSSLCSWQASELSDLVGLAVLMLIKSMILLSLL